VLHRADDNPTAMHFHDYYDTYRLLAGYIAALDMQVVPEGHTCKIKPI
jgi:hypothetical protein